MQEKEVGGAIVPLTRKQRLVVTVASAVVVAVAFQAMTIARNNYNLWRLEFMALEMATTLVGSFLANLAGGIEHSGAAWAARYLRPEQGFWYRVLANLPAATVRAAIMTALVSIPNAAYVPVAFYRETVELPPLAVVVRFLADIPQAILLCLAVLMLVRRFVKE